MKNKILCKISECIYNNEFNCEAHNVEIAANSQNSCATDSDCTACHTFRLE